ncbi:hypothetical protein [Nitrospira sp. Nam74]
MALRWLAAEKLVARVNRPEMASGTVGGAFGETVWIGTSVALQRAAVFKEEAYIHLGIVTNHKLSYDCTDDKPHTKEEIT